MLEDYYTSIKFNSGHDPHDLINNRVQQAIQSAEDESILDVANRAGQLVHRYVRDFAPEQDQEHEILDVEKHVEVSFQTPNLGITYNLQCYIDLLTRHRPSGKVWQWDHKTFGSKPWTADEIMMDSQQAIYALAMKKLGVPVFGLKYNMLNTRNYKNFDNQPPDKLFVRENSHRTDYELEQLTHEIGLMVEDMAKNSDDRRRSPKRECSLCPYINPCQLNMKGMPLEDVIGDDFVYKK
jgi:hypothetical protein